jgi:hypothetical protein
MGNGETRPLKYQGHELLQSDHRPVSATFELGIKMIDSAKLRAVRAEAEAAVSTMSSWE